MIDSFTSIDIINMATRGRSLAATVICSIHLRKTMIRNNATYKKPLLKLLDSQRIPKNYPLQILDDGVVLEIAEPQSLAPDDKIIYCIEPGSTLIFGPEKYQNSGYANVYLMGSDVEYHGQVYSDDFASNATMLVFRE